MMRIIVKESKYGNGVPMVVSSKDDLIRAIIMAADADNEEVVIPLKDLFVDDEEEVE